MNNLKRFTVCKLAGHHGCKVAYPPSPEGEATGTFLRCQTMRQGEPRTRGRTPVAVAASSASGSIVAPEDAPSEVRFARLSRVS